jgi:protein-S-isoprenylcysteine O-methyltransferase Ste14
MTTSRSTPRLRLTALLLLGMLVIVATSQRTLATGLPGLLLQLGGLACIACAALGRVWTSVFIAGRKDAELVRAGPYGALRHPLYALSLLAMLGAGLTTRSITLTLALLAVCVVIYARAAREEDRFLHGAHGAAFEQYAREVRAFLPRWTDYAVPEALEVRPRVLWKAFLDGGSLLGYWLLLVLADALQLASVSPTWITLP